MNLLFHVAYLVHQRGISRSLTVLRNEMETWKTAVKNALDTKMEQVEYESNRATVAQQIEALEKQIAAITENTSRDLNAKADQGTLESRQLELQNEIRKNYEILVPRLQEIENRLHCKTDQEEFFVFLEQVSNRLDEIDRNLNANTMILSPSMQTVIERNDLFFFAREILRLENELADLRNRYMNFTTFTPSPTVQSASSSEEIPNITTDKQ
ncbi:MAG: hypothetical protein C4527_11535 [Candidatus Omnitrophota bacterium]|nr:MAG: hypothetical protein C4527_11535 [Candidatus Omnitrophota bacterium]